MKLEINPDSIDECITAIIKVFTESSTAATADAKATPLTIDDLRAALQRFTAANGMPAGIELLKGFDCARISELAEKGDDVKAAFIAKCPEWEAA
jgi:cellulase/cellobiase CelA1